MIAVLATGGTPVWVTILVGVLGGLLGTVVSTQLRISHERRAELRSRMLEAADDYVKGLDAARRLASGAVLPHVSASFFVHIDTETAEAKEAEADEAFAAADKATDEIAGPLARIRLLFGPESRAVQHAEHAEDEVRAIHIALLEFGSMRYEREPDGSSIPNFYSDDDRSALMDRVHERENAARESLDAFCREARWAIAGQRWGRLAGRGKRRRPEMAQVP